MNNQRQLALAIAIYAQDNQQHLLPAAGIWEKLAPYTGSNKYILICPTRGIKAGIGYGYNQWLRGQKITGIGNPQSILLTADCDCKSRPHAITTKQDIDPRHGGVFIASFLDGHTAIISPNSQFLLRPITTKAASAKIMPSKNAARSSARQ